MDHMITSRSAELSPCGQYRYLLTRRLMEGQGVVVFVMLNPSTADGTVDDATIRRCIGFAGDWGYRELRVVNLFAWRATRPKDMLRAVDPVGPDGDAWIQRTCQDADRVVCAWGAHNAMLVRWRATAVKKLLQDDGHVLHHLGLSAAGAPRHPLFLLREIQPQVWG